MVKAEIQIKFERIKAITYKGDANIATATSEGLWLCGILKDMNILKPEESVTLHEDDGGCVAMATHTLYAIYMLHFMYSN